MWDGDNHYKQIPLLWSSAPLVGGTALIRRKCRVRSPGGLLGEFMDSTLQSIFYGYNKNGSGGGSTIEYTHNLRLSLPKILQKFNVKTLIDAPCGDLVWMSIVLEQCPDLVYIGGDLDIDIVAQHSQTYANIPNRTFLYADITEDYIGHADMWMMRDVLFHLTHECALKALKNFVKHNIPYLFTTTHGPDSVDYSGNQWTVNHPIPMGSRECVHFGLLNLCAPPFNLPEPVCRIDDTYGPHPKRDMCVWTRDQIYNRIK